MLPYNKSKVHTQSWCHLWKWSKNEYLHTKYLSLRFYVLYKIGRIRNYLDEKSTEILIYAFITCLIDHCNNLLYGLPDSQIAKLQRIQNSAARLVTRTRFHYHITPVFQKLHWLPVRYRIMHEMLILTYIYIHRLAPLYLQEPIQEYKPTRNLRSSSKLNLISATVSTLTYGHRSFSKTATELWNNLPMHVKNCRTVSQFKSSLKTHLFKVAFDD